MKNKLTDIIKFHIFILLLPVVVAGIQSFMAELQELPHPVVGAFLSGVFTFLIVYHFIYEPKGIYQYGQNLVATTFKFFTPLARVAPFALPIYTILLLILLYFAGLFPKWGKLNMLLMFLVGFTLCQHVVFTAKALREEDKNAIKPNYFFAMSLVIVFNLFLIALLLGLVLKDFSFGNFFIVTMGETEKMYRAFFEQLFVP